MKSKTKRLSALLLSLAMCVSFIQIPAFAEEAHSGDVAARSVSITSDGSFTITKRCDTHKDSVGASCTETTTGKIGTKIENGVTVSDPTKNVNVEGIAVKVTGNPATCVTPATVVYEVTVDDISFTSDKFETSPATGVHNTAEIATVKTYDEAEELVKQGQYKLVDNTATCEAAGTATYEKICKTCNKPVATEVVSLSSPKKAHDHVTVDEVVTAATCSTSGSKYVVDKCKNCGLVFTKKYTEVSATGLHNYVYTVTCDKEFVTDDTKESATFTVKGECAVCKAKVAEQSITGITATIEKDKTVAPTSACKPGSVTYTVKYTAPAVVEVKEGTEVTQKVDTKEFKTEVTVPYYLKGVDPTKDNHNWSTPAPDDDSVVEATCTAAGKYNLVKTCADCGEKEVVATVKIPKIAHKAAAAVKENVVNATYAKAGSYDLVTRCADCGKVLSTSHKTIAKLTVKAPTLSSVKNVKGKKATVSWKKASSVSGTQVQYSTSKSFKSAKSVKTTASSKTISKLSKNKKYYVRVRSYKVSGGKTYYSSWSSVKTVTIKK